MADPEQTLIPKIKYPCTFTFGFIFGTTLTAFVRRACLENLSARPFGYGAAGLTFGCFFKYYDYHRRMVVEQVLIAEDQNRYFKLVSAVNHTRIGEEDEIGNLVDYLSTQTVRP